MAERSKPPFRADHVGSLLRPRELTDARAAFKSGAVDQASLRAVEDQAITEVIELQRAVGLRTVTDGEFRRTAWHLDFIYSLEGVEKAPKKTDRITFHGVDGIHEFDVPAMVISSPVRLREPIFADAFTFLRDHAMPGQTPKLTIPSPSMVHYPRGSNSVLDDSIYADEDTFWEDLTAAYAAQVRGVYELGCRYLQLDDVSLAYINDPAQREHIQELGQDPDHLHERYIANINRVLANRPEDLTVTTHLCRGNNESMWMAEGSYDFVAEALFGELAVDGYFLEFDDARSGSFEPLRFVPKNKQVVLGLVTTKSPDLEDKDLLKRRIEEASKYIDIDQLCLSGQCGFSSTERGNKLSIDDERAKLELIVEVADDVWGR